MAGHHLIMGTLVDYLSGEAREDTHDERYRQKIARMLVEEKGYRREEIHSRYPLVIQVGPRRASLSLDFLIRLLDRDTMLVQYAPGSIVTRRRSVVAISRIVSPVQIPVVVVTNGMDAEIVNAATGDVMGTGLHAIPVRDHLVAEHARFPWDAISEKRREMESRIAYAYEVDDRCPCDDSVCSLPE
jgi:hypothetical protein